jgi:SAM-dependent methyltransferase
MTFINYENKLTNIDHELKEEKFDIIIFAAVIEHLDKPEIIIKYMKKFLNKDGYFLLTAPSVHSKWLIEFLAFKLRVINANLVREHKRYYNKQQYETCLNFVLLSLTTGILLKPRRSLDWTEMKVKNYDTETDNYIDFENNKFVFNKYKTAKTYGEQSIEIPSKLARILRRWVRHTDKEYLLSTFTNPRVCVSRLTQLHNKIFGKNISTSMLRHIFLTNLYEDTPSIAEMNQTATEMAHTPAVALQYVKKSKK